MDNLEYIDDYFQGLLQPDEKDRFEQRMLDDESFADEVAFYLSAQKVVQEKLHDDKKTRFKELYTQTKTQPAIIRSLNRTWLYAAAAVVVLLAAGIIFLMQPSSGPQLADRYIQENLNTLSVTMGSREDSLQSGLQLYNEGRFAEAAQQFETILHRDTANYTAKTNAGLAYLRLSNYDKAVSYFNQLRNYTSLRSNPGEFYLALTLLKRNKAGDKEEAKRLLQEVVQQNKEEKETAEQWLKKL